jgi:hypothetical protein
MGGDANNSDPSLKPVTIKQWEGKGCKIKDVVSALKDIPPNVVMGWVEAREVQTQDEEHIKPDSLSEFLLKKGYRVTFNIIKGTFKPLKKKGTK